MRGGRPTLLEEWLGRSEKPIETHLEIIDPHHHLWDPGFQPKGLMTALYWFRETWMCRVLFCRSRRAYKYMLRRMLLQSKEAWGFLNHMGGRNELRGPSNLDRYMMEELRRDMEGNNVAKTVYIECGWEPEHLAEPLRPVGEVEMVLACAASDELLRPNAMVAHANLLLPEVEETLKRLKAHNIVRGIRHALAYYEDKSVLVSDDRTAPSHDFSKTPQFRAGFALLEKYGFSFDSWHYHLNLPALTDLAKSFPNTTIICDHVGTPVGVGPFAAKRSTAVWEEWRESMRELSRCPNVYVKLSGMGMGSCGLGLHERRRPPTSDELAKAFGPYYTYCVELFGFERCMFASNFPVDKMSGSYTAHWNCFKKICNEAGYTEEQKKQLLSGTAKKVYGL